MKPLHRILAFIPGEPVAQGRPRATVVAGHAKVYDPENAAEWKGAAALILADACRRQVGIGAIPFPEGPVHLTVVFRFTLPKGDRRKTDAAKPPVRFRDKKPDADNLVKSLMDAAKGVVWNDDSQVARLVVEKQTAAQDAPPGVWLIVRPTDARLPILAEEWV